MGGILSSLFTIRSSITSNNEPAVDPLPQQGTADATDNGGVSTVQVNLDNDPRLQQANVYDIYAVSVAVFANRVISALNIARDSLSTDPDTRLDEIINYITTWSQLYTMEQRLREAEYIYRVRPATTPATTTSDAPATTTSDNVNAMDNADTPITDNVTTPATVNAATHIDTTAEVQALRRLLLATQPQVDTQPVGNGEGGLTEQELVENTQTMDGGVHLDSYTDQTPESQRICAICHDGYTEECIIRRLNCCIHMFHKDCIAPWLARHRSCPMCRSLVVRSDRDAAQTTAATTTTSDNTNMNGATNMDGDTIEPQLTWNMRHMTINPDGSIQSIPIDQYNANVDIPNVVGDMGSFIQQMSQILTNQQQQNTANVPTIASSSLAEVVVDTESVIPSADTVTATDTTTSTDSDSIVNSDP